MGLCASDSFLLMISLKRYKTKKGNASCNRKFKKENIKFYSSVDNIVIINIS